MYSMPHCRFEYTYEELNQCIDKMIVADDVDDLDLNHYEQDAFRCMYDMCKLYVKEFERLSEEFIDE